MSDIVRHIWFFVCMSIWSNIRLDLSICALERLSNEETHCKLANFAILKFSLIKLFIHKQLTVDKLWISATFVCIALHTSIQLNIWSEWLGNMTWPIKRQQQRQRQMQWQFQIHLQNLYLTNNSLLWIQTLPDQTGGWQNFTISAKFHKFGKILQYWKAWNTCLLVYTGISGVRAVSQFLRCFNLHESSL